MHGASNEGPGSASPIDASAPSGDAVEPPGDISLEALVHHTALPHTRMSLVFDRTVRRIGDAASWVWALLLAVIVVNVTSRYIFGQGFIQLEELQWHLYSFGFLVGLAYVFEADDHVRVDVLHDRFSLRGKAWVELYGILLLLLPFLLLVLIKAVPFIADSLATGERSQAPGGLPGRFVVKSFLFLGFGLLAVAALSRLSRVSSLLFGSPRAVSAKDGK